MKSSANRRRVIFTCVINLFLSAILLALLPISSSSSAFSGQIAYQSVQGFPFFDDFSTDKGWLGFEPGGWERKPAKAGGGGNGNPDPGIDYTREGYILGFAIGGNYPNDLTDLTAKSVISPPIDCSGQYAVKSVKQRLHEERGT
jgi:hypothetical protein